MKTIYTPLRNFCFCSILLSNWCVWDLGVGVVQGNRRTLCWSLSAASSSSFCSLLAQPLQKQNQIHRSKTDILHIHHPNTGPWLINRCDKPFVITLRRRLLRFSFRNICGMYQLDTSADINSAIVSAKMWDISFKLRHVYEALAEHKTTTIFDMMKIKTRRHGQEKEGVDHVW